MEKLVVGLLESVGRIAYVAAKEVLKGGLFIYKGVSGVSASAGSGIKDLYEEAKGEIREPAAHQQQVPKKERKQEKI